MNELLRVPSRRIVGAVLLALAAAGCGPTEPVPGPLEGTWTGTSFQTRPSCSSAARCTYQMTLELHDDGGTLTGQGVAGSGITYVGTRDARGRVVLHAGREGVEPWMLIGALSADGATFTGQQFTGVGESVPSEGHLEEVNLTRE